MRNALIDIGSNTIRLVVYENTTEIENIADYAGLIAEVKNGAITPAGITKIIAALIKMKKIATDLDCNEIYAFATASLRGITDKDGLIEIIKHATGIEIHIISGELEALYDYEGLKVINNIKSGAAFDLGGGSCQLMVFEDNSVIESVSLPIGSLKLHTQFVSGVLPVKAEREEMSRHVAYALKDIKSLANSGFKSIYAMGGAVFALSSLSKAYFDEHQYDLTQDTLSRIILLSQSDIEKIVPKRVTTVIPAAITMLEILKFSGALKIIPTPAGVRDGILHKNILINCSNE